MKRTLFILSFLIPQMVSAQFNTIGKVLSSSIQSRKQNGMKTSHRVGECRTDESLDPMGYNQFSDSLVIAPHCTRDIINAPLEFSSLQFNTSSHRLTQFGTICHPPLKGTLRISSKFGKRSNPFNKSKTEFHSGLDFAASAGTPVYAILPGEVTSVGYDTRAGNYITVKHGAFTLSYCHLLTLPLLPKGYHVLPGQPLGQVGSTGRSTGPHLHLTLKRNGQVIDPAILLRYFKLM